MLSATELVELAGKAAYARGVRYHAEGRVRLTAHDADGLRGEAEGSDIYALWLKFEDGRWRWQCDCPAADDGSFCKHLVAAVLAAHDDDEGEAGTTANADAGRMRRHEPRRDELLDFLRAQPAGRLAAWLKALADEDPDVAKRLHLYRAAADPATLKAALGKLLNTGGFLDWRGSRRYAQRLDAAIAQLEDQLACDPAACRELCGYALARLFKVFRRCDDSHGEIGDRTHAVAQLHARACTAAPPGKALARPLFALQQHDEWGLLPLAAYWEALGGDGQLAYGNLIAGELDRLPAQPDSHDRYGSETFSILRRAEAYARCSGDFELLQRILRHDLRYPHDHLRVIESLREFGREREALAFAEDSVKRCPDSPDLRAALATCLQDAGLDEESLEQVWRAFRMRQHEEQWDALKHAAGVDWPAWRERALAEVASRERGEVGHRVQLLVHDGDLDAAVALARVHPVRIDILEALARRIERGQAPVAGRFYLRVAEVRLQEPYITSAKYPGVVALLKRCAKLAPDAEWRPKVAEIRDTHGKKRKLMALLEEAGL
jgi:SWIM zinc finger